MCVWISNVNSVLNTLIWGISDTVNGFMVVPNLIAVFLLAPVVFKLIKQHFGK